MSGHSAIADVGGTIVEMLRDRLEALDSPVVARDEVALASPADVGEGAGTTPRLTLYLYRVQENEHLKNAERQAITPDTRRNPPLALDLYYLLTAHPSGTGGGNGGVDRSAEQHVVLGRAMQVMHDNAVLDGSALRGTLAEEVRISPYPETTNDVVGIWSTFADRPYRPSVAYLVSPVLIESTATESTQRVVETRTDYYAAGTDGQE
jgi:hypothetical protein